MENPSLILSLLSDIKTSPISLLCLRSLIDTGRPPTGKKHFCKRIILTLTNALRAYQVPHLDLLLFIHCSQKERCYLPIIPLRKAKFKEAYPGPTAPVWEEWAVPWGFLGSVPLLKAYTPTRHCSSQRPAWEPKGEHLLQGLGS